MSSDLPSLIRELIGNRTFEELANDCGGQPTRHRLYSMARTPIRQFPTVDTIQGISKGLKVRPGAVVNACAVSLGLVEEQDTKAPLLIPETARDLTDDQKSLIVSMINEFAKANIRGRQDVA